MLARRPLARPLMASLALLICAFVANGGLAGGLATAHADGEDPGKLVLVLDSSGSMKEPASGGETKIVAARKSLHSVIAGLPATQPVGLRVYGAEVFSRGDAGACTDSQLKVPVAAGNRAQLLAAIDSYKPYGETPIGYALQEAGDDLGSTGKRSIVLVSDGEPTCEPDPCAVARQLAKAGIDLTIDVVGLDVGPRARTALRCIADAGHGTYYDVRDSHEFTQSLQKVATRAVRPFTTIGRPVSGTDASTTAPTITSGDWQDRTNGVAERFYQIKRTQAGSTVHFSAAFRDPETTVFNRVQLVTPEGDICGAGGDVQQLATNSLVSAAATAGPLDSRGDLALDSPCATSPILIAKLGYSGRTLGVPIEIRVTELPRVDDIASLPEPAKEPHWVAPPSGTPRAVRGGTSFRDAPLLSSGSYKDDIVQGETLTYQVELDWGQQLTAQVDLPAVAEGRDDPVTGSPLVNVSVFSPARTPAGSSSVDDRFPQKFLRREGGMLGIVSGPVAFRNTAEVGDEIQGSDLAGRYTVTVFLGKRGNARSVPLPFNLHLGVSGTPHGAPDFVGAPTSPDSESPAPSAHASTPTKEQPTPASSGTGGGFPMGPVLGGLGALALVAAAGLTVRSMRRSAPGRA